MKVQLVSSMLGAKGSQSQNGKNPFEVRHEMKITNVKDSRKSLHLIHDTAIPASLQSSLWT